jgi:ribosomal protein L37AE/L43A
MSEPERWVAEAIAEQEEHIKRSTSCQGQVGRAHHFEHVPSGLWIECTTCAVTLTRGDYATKTAHQTKET